MIQIDNESKCANDAQRPGSVGNLVLSKDRVQIEYRSTLREATIHILNVRLRKNY